MAVKSHSTQPLSQPILPNVQGRFSVFTLDYFLDFQQGNQHINIRANPTFILIIKTNTKDSLVGTTILSNFNLRHNHKSIVALDTF